MFMPIKKMLCMALAITLALTFPLVSFAAPGDTVRVSVATGGTEANNDSYQSAISADGRYVTFYSFASNLVSGDTNGSSDIFRHDTQTDITTRVTVAWDGTQGNDDSTQPVLSDNGRYVAYVSDAYNLVLWDVNSASDVFRHDTQTGATIRISLADNEKEANAGSNTPSISSNGRYIAFSSYAFNLVMEDTNGVADIFFRDCLLETTTRILVATDGTEGNQYSYTPSISADGRYVAFISHASNLIIGDPNGVSDIFVHDTQTHTTILVSLATDGTRGNGSSDYPTISADGRYVAFTSISSNLVSGDTNGSWDVFVHDTQTGTTTRVSVASDGTQGNNTSYFPSTSIFGRYVTFSSRASNLVSGDSNGSSDIFVHDTQNGLTTRISVATDGTEGNSSSSYPSISDDGHHVAFTSNASNLVIGDTNGSHDIFINENDLTITDPDNVGFYVPVQKKWFLKDNKTNGWNDYVAFRFGGTAEFKPVTGDWDNDGVDTAGFYVPSQKKWYLKNNQTNGWNDIVYFNFGGLAPWKPVAGDWNGDGVDTVGFYVPDQQKWYLKNDQSNGWTDFVSFKFGGGADWVPVAGDWNNDGIDTVGFYVPNGKRWYLKNNQISGWNDYVAFRFGGTAEFMPVTGDWDGDGSYTVGFYVPSQMKWYLKNNQTSGWNDYLYFYCGKPFDVIPVVGDWK